MATQTAKRDGYKLGRGWLGHGWWRDKGRSGGWGLRASWDVTKRGSGGDLGGSLQTREDTERYWPQPSTIRVLVVSLGDTDDRERAGRRGLGKGGTLANSSVSFWL